MADEAPNNPRPFNVRTIKYLVALMSQNDLSEIDLREGELRIRLLRGPRGTVVTTTAPAPVPMTAPPAMPAAPVNTAAPEKADKNLLTIKSPTPGTFYVAATPDAPPFIKKGDRVTPTTVVCIIEAMKIFNEITADCTGIVTDVLVDNQQAVEYGQVLFRVDPTA